MFHAARSGKQHLAFECLENRNLLNADCGPVDFQDGLPKQAPATAIMTLAPTERTTGPAETKGQVPPGYSVQPLQQQLTLVGEYDLGDFESDETGVPSMTH